MPNYEVNHSIENFATHFQGFRKKVSGNNKTTSAEWEFNGNLQNQQHIKVEQFKLYIFLSYINIISGVVFVTLHVFPLYQ